MTNNVVSIDQGRGNQTPVGSSQAYLSGSAAPASLKVSYAEHYDAPPTEPSKKSLSLQQLYPDLPEDSRMMKGLNLIERARATLQNALIFDPSANFFSFDQEIPGKSQAQLAVKKTDQRNLDRSRPPSQWTVYAFRHGDADHG